MCVYFQWSIFYLLFNAARNINEYHKSGVQGLLRMYKKIISSSEILAM